MLSKESLSFYREAGHIATKVRDSVKRLVKKDMPIIKICEIAEKMIIKKGGKPAFPCNVCVNEVAAHYSSPLKDKRTIPKGSLVKVDIGVHVNGYIADTATTISLDPKYDKMIYAVEEALARAIKVIRPGIRVSEVGKAIEKTIEKYGYKPIENLSGHQVGRYVLHAGKSIPNVSKLGIFGRSEIKEGEVYAVEPFLTSHNGSGEVKSTSEAYIHRFQKQRSVKSPQAKRLLKKIKNNFRNLPFSQRWFHGFSEEELNSAFQELFSRRCLASYPSLIEKKRNPVAQAEHTVIVTKEGCYKTT
jgi:methionyl aminopeptidase